jgi:CPA1 family monovalent cation:H+ antiporter
MDFFTIIAVLITLTTAISFTNERYFGLPTHIGVTIGGLFTSLVLIALGSAGFIDMNWLRSLIEPVDFNKILMHGILGALLFAGALEINLSDLAERKWAISLLATFGVLISTVVVGTLTWYAMPLLGLRLPYIYALLFGALISPTDPIAVLALLKRVGVPKNLEVMISGEALFNDGVGVVVFTLIIGVIQSGQEFTLGHSGMLFLKEAVGGAVYGFVLGYIAYLMLREIDAYTVEILVTLSVVTGGYVLAETLHVSGPIAMVVAGLFIGNHGRLLAMSEQTREHLDKFWVVVDEVLNALLFLIIGLEVLILRFSGSIFLAGLITIVIVLFGRFVAVSGPILLLRKKRGFPPSTIRILTWAGIRGGIAIALALSIPPSPHRNLIVDITYVVVVFSLLVQGLTVEPLVRRTLKEVESREEELGTGTN